MASSPRARKPRRSGKRYLVDFLIVTPGIRLAGGDAGDQVRVTTPAKAMTDGADYLVVGRPITQAKDPKAAAELVVKDMAGI